MAFMDFAGLLCIALLDAYLFNIFISTLLCFKCHPLGLKKLMLCVVFFYAVLLDKGSWVIMLIRIFFHYSLKCVETDNCNQRSNRIAQMIESFASNSGLHQIKLFYFSYSNPISKREIVEMQER